MSNRKFGARRAMAAALSLALLCGTAPWGGPAFAEDACAGECGGVAACSASAEEGDGSSILRQAQARIRAGLIDAQPETYAPGEIIVEYDGATSNADGRDAIAAVIPGASIEAIESGVDEGAGAERGTAGASPSASSEACPSNEACPSSRAEGGVALVELPRGCSVGEAVVAAECDPAIAHAQPNYRYRPLETHSALAEGSTWVDLQAAPLATGDASPSAGAIGPQSVMPNDPIAQVRANDKTIENQWWLAAVRAPEAWEYARCDHEVTVAVLDTGINFAHEDLAANILKEYAWDATRDECLDKSPTQSALSHGSHVAGIVSGEANNGVGIAGASYNANILPIAVFELSGGQAVCDDTTLIKAYNYLMSDPFPDDGVGKSVIERTNLHVVNMSLGGYAGDDEILRSLIARAQDKGVLTVAAGGNGDDNGNPRTQHSYPSDYDEVMSVVALKDSVERSYWSDYNECKDIAAPGVDIWSTWYTGNDYYCTSGTSMAAPLVAGCAALLWKYSPDLTVQEVKDALYSSAVDLGPAGKDAYYGWGRIDIAAAIESIGTAHIRAERQTMGRTGTQQLEAIDVRNPGAEHVWQWSTSDDAVAVVAADGKLTALAPGSVVVCATAADDEGVSGRIGITVTEITVPGSVSCQSDGVAYRVTLEWNAADAAKKYAIRRALAKEGPFATVSEISAEAGRSAYRYVDVDVRSGVEYYYTVVPVGSIGALDVEGAETQVVRGFFTDKKALSDRLDEVDDIVSSAVVSEDGASVRDDVQWTTQANLDELVAVAQRARKLLSNDAVRQAVVDATVERLVRAIDSYREALKPGLVDTGGQGLEPGGDSAQGGAGASEDPSSSEGASDGSVSGKGSAPAASTVVKAPNTMRVKAKFPKVKQRKAKRVLKRSKVLRIAGAQGALSFAKVGKSKLAVNKKTGAVTVPKNCRKGVWKLTVKVRAAGNGKYLPCVKTVTVKVKVR